AGALAGDDVGKPSRPFLGVVASAPAGRDRGISGSTVTGGVRSAGDPERTRCRNSVLLPTLRRLAARSALASSRDLCQWRGPGFAIRCAYPLVGPAREVGNCF